MLRLFRLSGDHRGAEKPVTGFHRTARLADVVGSTWGPGPRKPSLGARGRTGAPANTTRGFDGRGALQMWPDGLRARGHARRPSELAPIGAGCCLADCHSHAAESNTPPPPTPAEARARRAKPGATRRQGEAQRPPRQGGLRVGVGGAVQTSRTTHPTQDPPPQTPAAAQSATRPAPCSCPCSCPCPPLAPPPLPALRSPRELHHR